MALIAAAIRAEATAAQFRAISPSMNARVAFTSRVPSLLKF